MDNLPQFINFWLINSEGFFLPAETAQQFLYILTPLLLVTQTCQIEITAKAVWTAEFLAQVKKSDIGASLPDVR